MADQPNLTPAMLTGIDNAIAASSSPTYSYVNASHAEFVDWLRTSGHDGRIVDFLAQREDCADAAPAAWARLAKVGQSAWFKALPQEQRRSVSRSIIGETAFAAYVEWVLATA